jgi:hypothetical protein
LEKTSRACAERAKQAEDLAKRSEEQLVAAENSFQQWRSQAERDGVSTQARREKVLKDAQARLAIVQQDAENRKREADEDLARETANADSALQQERAKLARRRKLVEDQGKDRHSRAETRLHNAEVEAKQAEARRDRQMEMAANNTKRLTSAVLFKVKHASQEAEKVSSKTLLRLDQAKNERLLRVEAAKSKAAATVEILERQARVAVVEIERLEKEWAQVHTECAEVEKEYELLVEKLRRELTIKADNWDNMAREAEDVSRQKVGDVQALAGKLKVALDHQTEFAKAAVEGEMSSLKERLEDHKQVVQKFVAKKSDLTTKVLKLAGSRIEDAGALVQEQVSAVQQRSAMTVDLAEKELHTTRELTEHRVSQAVDHLMTYLGEVDRPESPNAGLRMELWIPLPDNPADIVLPGMPQ